jgi:hypothetical protein
MNYKQLSTKMFSLEKSLKLRVDVGNGITKRFLKIDKTPIEIVGEWCENWKKIGNDYNDFDEVVLYSHSLDKYFSLKHIEVVGEKLVLCFAESLSKTNIE